LLKNRLLPSKTDIYNLAQRPNNRSLITKISATGSDFLSRKTYAVQRFIYYIYYFYIYPLLWLSTLFVGQSAEYLLLHITVVIAFHHFLLKYLILCMHVCVMSDKGRPREC